MKYKNMEQEALPKMEAILEGYGLQVTLKIFVDSLQNLIKRRGKSIEALLIMETIKGLHAGYLRRHEEADDDEY